MASRKRKPSSPQIGLSFAGPSLPVSTEGNQVQCLANPASAGGSIGLTEPKPADLGSSFNGGLRDSRGASEDGALGRTHQDAGSNPAEPFNVDLDSFDDYDDEQVHDDVPRLRLVDPPREVSIIVESSDTGFWVSRLRDNGTTWASVLYSRKELEELAGRIASALMVNE